jgi:solute carrier family 35 (adenosine 3'-phospho 5'-phosphosulfate transporter), member B2
VLCAVAIIGSLLAYSVLQERIMTRPYAPSGRRFTSSLFLVLANRLAAVVASLLLVLIRRDSFADARPRAHPLAYVAVSLTNVVATSCQYEALKYLSFPALTVAKCAKVLPVMLVVNFKSARYNPTLSPPPYSTTDYAVAVTVAAGSVGMVVGGSVSAQPAVAASASSNVAFGFALMVSYLLFDACASTYQESLFRQHRMSVVNQLLYTNICAVCLAACALLTTGGLQDPLAVLADTPAARLDVVALSIAAVAGQFAISHTIRSFGALVYAAVMTARQFMSVVISNMVFDHQLTTPQWMGAITVFVALFLRTGCRSATLARHAISQTTPAFAAATSDADTLQKSPSDLRVDIEDSSELRSPLLKTVASAVYQMIPRTKPSEPATGDRSDGDGTSYYATRQFSSPVTPPVHDLLQPLVLGTSFVSDASLTPVRL